MATHDYVIANGTGNAVRSDLNNALAAIVSNNSSSSEPSTKYAYQWWADTTTGQLKLRNSANNAWVTIFELDGTMLMEDGTVSAPGLAFASDLNTGFFRSAADKINFATGGVERLEIGSSEVVFNDGSNDVDFRVESNGNANMLFVDGGNDRVGIGTSSPSSALDVSGAISLSAVALPSAGTARIFSRNTDNALYLQTASGNAINLLDSSQNTMASFEATSIKFNISNSEKARIDSSGRLLVGTSTARSNMFNSTLSSNFQIEGTNHSSSTASIVRNSNDVSGGLVVIGKTRGATPNSNTIINEGDGIGGIVFQASDGSQLVETAAINCFSDAAPGANDMPGRLVFSTTADSASSPTERMRISKDGEIAFYAKNSGAAIHIGGVTENSIYRIGSGMTGIHFSTNSWLPTGSTGLVNDNNNSLGGGSHRMAVIYAGTGTINTSDVNLKQDIEDLNTAELSVATTIKGLIKKFRFIDAVAIRGDDARIHVGVIAQEVEQAFVDAGLNPRRYGLFCEDELEDGSMRLGIRYNELLAFVIAAI